MENFIVYGDNFAYNFIEKSLTRIFDIFINIRTARYKLRFKLLHSSNIVFVKRNTFLYDKELLWRIFFIHKCFSMGITLLSYCVSGPLYALLNSQFSLIIYIISPNADSRYFLSSFS